MQMIRIECVRSCSSGPASIILASSVPSLYAQAPLERKVWISIVDGIRGVCVFDEHGIATAFMVMEPSTDYYQIMTKSWVMPKLVGEVI